MPEKPQRKRKVAVVEISHHGTTREICFHAAKEFAELFGEFGHLLNRGGSECWVLHVDGRYEFGEVVEYIKNWG